MFYKFQTTSTESFDIEAAAATSVPSESSDEEDFEFISPPMKEEPRALALLESFGKMPHEKGLDQQNFECESCKCSIGS